MKDKILNILRGKEQLEDLVKDFKIDIVGKIPNYQYCDSLRFKTITGLIIDKHLVIAQVQAFECTDWSSKYVLSFYVKTEYDEICSLDQDEIALAAAKAYDKSTTEVIYNDYFNHITPEMASIAKKINEILENPKI